MQSDHEQKGANSLPQCHLDNSEQYSELAEHAVDTICKLTADGIDAAALPDVQEMLSGFKELLHAFIM